MGTALIDIVATIPFDLISLLASSSGLGDLHVRCTLPPFRRRRRRCRRRRRRRVARGTTLQSPDSSLRRRWRSRAWWRHRRAETAQEKQKIARKHKLGTGKIAAGFGTDRVCAAAAAAAVSAHAARAAADEAAAPAAHEPARHAAGGPRRLPLLVPLARALRHLHRAARALDGLRPIRRAGAPRPQRTTQKQKKKERVATGCAAPPHLPEQRRCLRRRRRRRTTAATG